jgi:hypothetical protein
MQLQPEPGEPVAKLGEEPPRILLILKPDDEIVGLCRPAGYAGCGGRVAGGSG